MGYHIHHTIVCTTWEERHLKMVHEKAKDIFPHGVSEITAVGMNGFQSFFVAPDGSKEGWTESKEFDECRDKFKSWMRKTNTYVDWVELSFGGDVPFVNTKILEYGKYEERG